MMRLITASRAIVLATGLVLATTAFASTEEVAAKPADEKFKQTVYFGPAFGFAEQDGSEFGWSMHILARFYRYAGVQLEYFNLGSIPHDAGELDGLYVGVMPILPVADGLGIFGQVGVAFSEAGDDVAGGGGVLFDLPIEILEQNNVDLTLRADYKYLNLDDGEHLLTLGFMFGLHK